MTRSIRQIAHRRGYMAIQVRERGNVPRGMKKAFNAASKKSWATTARHFHTHLRDRRFTPEHAEAAGYSARKGQLVSPGSPKFATLYYGRKRASARHGGGPGKANPLEWSGRTRRQVRSASIRSSSKGGKAAYSGASRLNLQNANSRIRMFEEFRRIIPREAEELAGVYDRDLDENLRQLDQ